MDNYKGLIERLHRYADFYNKLGGFSGASIEYEQAADAITALTAENAQLRAELEQVKRERDAAVEELRGFCWCCINGRKWDKAPVWSNMTTCKHIRERGALAVGGGKGGRNCPHWQWHGPQKEE